MSELYYGECVPPAILDPILIVFRKPGGLSKSVKDFTRSWAPGRDEFPSAAVLRIALRYLSSAVTEGTLA
jgi:hypothetical protein